MRLIAVAVAITLSGVAFYSNADGERRAPHGRPAIMQRVISELDLSKEQIDKIKGELRSEKENVAPLLKRLHETRKGLRETIQAGTDEKAIREAHSKVAEVEGDLAVQRAKIRAKIVPHLTEEQIQKMKKIEAKLDDMATDAIQNFGKRLEE